jgi:hypothetical protein
MGAASVEPAPLTVPPATLPDEAELVALLAGAELAELAELVELLELLEPQAAAVADAAITTATALKRRIRKVFSFGRMCG